MPTHYLLKDLPPHTQIRKTCTYTYSHMHIILRHIGGTGATLFCSSPSTDEEVTNIF